VPDLAAQSASGQKTVAGYQLKGVVRNFGPGTYALGRSFRFERWNGSAWVVLAPAQPLVGLIPAGATKTVFANLGATPVAGTKVRLHLSAGDAQPLNDNSPAFTVVLPDLNAQNVAGHQTIAGYHLQGQVHNNGPGVYTGGRSFRFERKVGPNWFALTALQPLTGPILAGGTKAVSATVPGTLPEGALVRLHITPGDAVPGNDNASAVMHASDLLAVSASKVGAMLHGTIHNNGPGTYTAGRTFRFERKVGASWVGLTAAAPIPGGPLVAGGNRAVSAVAPPLPSGTKIRLHISPGDANAVNDNSPAFTVP
jgi:hypothetical protein